MRMEQLRWGILGCGNVTEAKSGPAFGKVPGSSLVAVMRRDGAKAADYAERHGVGRWHDTAGTLINDPGVNAVYIATPPGSHCELALEVAAAGKPCYVEKPMARNAAECQKMVDAFAAAGLPLFVAYYRRGLPHFTQVKAMIDDGRHGPLLGVRYQFYSGHQANGTPEGWRYQPEISGGGLFWDLGSHALDLFDWWLGPLGFVQGQASKQSEASPVEEAVAMTAVSGSGVSFVGDWSFISREDVDRFELEFAHARVSGSVFGPMELRIETEIGETQTLVYPQPEHIQSGLIANIVSSLRTGAPALSTGVTAARTNAVIDKVAATA
ncbi:Gfo/Idh/MocA family oxidoreductase [Akkermansiaceae bacterium]|nr:Gfo/Idh/MocA family oxidoreductase [Akkermansiaceae bacterium]